MTTGRGMLIVGTGALGFLLAIAPMGACGQDQKERSEASIHTENAALGGKLFKGNCAECHGPSGEGQPDWNIRKADGLLPAPPLNGDGHTWHHGDGTLFRIISEGGAIYDSPDLPGFKSGMPAFGEKLSREEMVSVISYLKSLWGEKMAQGLGLLKRESQAIVSETDPFPTRTK